MRIKKISVADANLHLLAKKKTEGYQIHAFYLKKKEGYGHPGKNSG